MGFDVDNWARQGHETQPDFWILTPVQFLTSVEVQANRRNPKKISLTASSQTSLFLTWLLASSRPPCLPPTLLAREVSLMLLQAACNTMDPALSGGAISVGIPLAIVALITLVSHPLLLSRDSSGIYLHNEKREIGKCWGIFLWLRLFVILIFILKDAFQIFKCMCAHITVSQDELQMTQSLLYLPHALGLSPEAIATWNWGKTKGRLQRVWTLISANSSFALTSAKILTPVYWFLYLSCLCALNKLELTEMETQILFI